MRTPVSKRCIALLLVLVPVFVGCATARIDVDVYKGPLANHEEVQLKQLTVMAVAARPLLVQLRDTIEWPEDTESCRNANLATDEKDDFVRYRFTKPHARRVNAILSLYKDRKELYDPGPYREIFETLQSSMDDYRKSWDTFTKVRHDNSPRSWNQLEKRSRGRGRGPAEELLAKEYQGFFKVNEKGYRGDCSSMWKAHKAVYDSKRYLGLGVKFEDRFPSKEVNDVFESLSNKEIVRLDAELLFPSDVEAQEIFTDEVTRIANAFLESREALHKLLRGVLQLLAAPGFASGYPSQAANAKALALKLMKIEYLKDADNEIPESISTAIRKIRDILSRDGRAEVYSDAKAVLAGLVNEKPIETAKWLLEADTNVSKKGRQFKFGIARALPNLREDDPARIAADVNASLPFTLGLESARLEDGLEKLSDEYIRSSVPKSKSDSASEEAKDKLLTALVHFAEKVLVIANDDILLKEDSRIERANSQGPSRTGSSARDRIDHYVVVLQSVGNSILIQADELYQRTEHLERIEAAKDRELDALGKAHSPQNAQIYLSSLLEALQEHVDDAASTSARLEARIKELEAKGTAITDAEKEELGKAKTDKSKADAEVQRLTAARGKIEVEARGVLADSLELAPDLLTPRALILQIRTRLKVKAASEPNNAVYNDAIDELDARIPPDSLPSSPPPSNTKTSKDAMDNLIAELRHEHLRAVETLGVDSSTARNIADALELAYAQRSGMVYIRPASAYLRSSYPSTSLQNDPRLGWHNMLGEYWKRCLPLVGECLANTDKDALRINTEIDKRFWQNVNTVRVSGAGNTNYVLVQDDIGNWYVKNYSADPKPIIDGAKNLALFSLGAELNTNLVERLDAQEKGVSPSLIEMADAHGTLGRLLGKYAENYRSQTIQDLTYLRGRIDKLDADVGTAWSESDVVKTAAETLKDVPKQSRSMLDEAIRKIDEGLGKPTEAQQKLLEIGKSIAGSTNKDAKFIFGLLEKALSDPEKTRKLLGALQKAWKPESADAALIDDIKKMIGDSDPAGHLIDALRDVRSFKAKVSKDVRDAKLPDAITDAQEIQKIRDKACELTAVAADGLVKEMIQRRKEVVKTFESGVIFIGEAAKS